MKDFTDIYGILCNCPAGERFQDCIAGADLKSVAGNSVGMFVGIEIYLSG